MTANPIKRKTTSTSTTVGEKETSSDVKTDEDTEKEMTAQLKQHLQVPISSVRTEVYKEKICCRVSMRSTLLTDVVSNGSTSIKHDRMIHGRK